ncbi:hypothetical protein [Ferrovibrio sp.]|uniref:hypothetical protein n=1 Tax=Ferrovibrio sp. TaxID=1917215 RepID=UPI003D1381FA
MRTIHSLLLILLLTVTTAVPAAAWAQDRPTRQAAEKLMETLTLEKRVDSIVQLYLQFMPQSTPEEQARARLLRERAPGAGSRFRGAVTNAAAAHYNRSELAALDQFFASDDGQRLIATAVGRALMSVGRGGNLKQGDLLRAEDFAGRPGLEKVVSKYPAFETAARNELGREFATEIGLLVMK